MDPTRSTHPIQSMQLSCQAGALVEPQPTLTEVPNKLSDIPSQVYARSFDSYVGSRKISRHAHGLLYVLLDAFCNSIGSSSNLRRHVFSKGVQCNQHQHSGCDNHGAHKAHHTQPAQPLEGLNEKHG